MITSPERDRTLRCRFIEFTLSPSDLGNFARRARRTKSMAKINDVPRNEFNQVDVRRQGIVLVGKFNS